MTWLLKAASEDQCTRLTMTLRRQMKIDACRRLQTLSELERKAKKSKRRSGEVQ